MSASYDKSLFPSTLMDGLRAIGDQRGSLLASRSDEDLEREIQALEAGY